MQLAETERPTPKNRRSISQKPLTPSWPKSHSIGQKTPTCRRTGPRVRRQPQHRAQACPLVLASMPALALRPSLMAHGTARAARKNLSNAEDEILRAIHHFAVSDVYPVDNPSGAEMHFDRRGRRLWPRHARAGLGHRSPVHPALQADAPGASRSPNTSSICCGISARRSAMPSARSMIASAWRAPT